jgi:preprotein translocase subunit SecA
VEYDDVMNKQREIVYDERQKVLKGANTRENVEAYIRDLIENGVEAHCEGRHPENWDIDGLVGYLGLYFPLAPGTTVPPEQLREGKPGLVEFLHRAAMAAYAAKEEQVGTDITRQVERWVMLRTIDQKWIEYLTTMEHFKEGIGLRAYGQRDPLVEYKNEAFHMFTELEESIQADIVANMFRVQVQHEPPPMPAPPRVLAASGPRAADGGNGGSYLGSAEPVAAGKVGRNDPCPCGSGLKYKRCHGK